ncbi:DUF1453 family protein [Neobacillus massiliamazoniensis]|uniref:Putative integral inner membrane protein n=1 Tax=Neobacillus massiliamazoniensis TaxID=1499688 RepID=A0A0U1NVE0_9BACI|nr:DUF1453 family protein [Neobacillus massiliamazoniensis]CRK82003.1 putative integral inner membrane protein [Neobacillus massiliamazoniensis]
MIDYLIIIIIISLLMLREKQIRPSRMWITPVLLILLTVSNILHSVNLTLLSFIMYFICLTIGLGLGVWRGKLEKIRVNSGTGMVTSQSSIVGIILFMGIILLRLIGGYWGKEYGVIALTNALIFIPLGSICARRYIIYLRYKQLKGE